ncbi:S1 family peptidase [Aquabacterium humicola]|uniref:S1 family peptidase n=1 Tax=Aquabacterium humicola TaxID=3237377 RepID=UPI0032EBEAB0
MSSNRSDPPATDPPASDAAAASPVDPPAPGTPAAPAADNAEHAELQRQGAKAAVRGEARASNPMLAAINQPDLTGESQQVWSGRRDAWESGHNSQQLPVSLPVQAAGGSAADDRAEDEAIFGVTRVLTFAGNRGLTSASGFFFERDGRLFVITSRHVLFDGPSAHAPDRIEIDLHTDPRDLTRLVTLSLLLYRNGVATWHQARDSGGEVDVAALELERDTLPAGCAIRPFGPQHLAAEIDQFDVGARLAIPGFPLGFFDTVHHLPVVRQASIASYYGVRFQGLGFFLTDARMHRGSSGSPVLAPLVRTGANPVRWCLLGVHSSRMDMASRDTAQDESLGLNCAWYADVLMALTAPR